MSNQFRQDRRGALGTGLALAGSLLLHSPAYAKREMSILVAYFGALINTAPVAVGLERGFYDTANVQVKEAVSTIGGGTAVRNMVGGGLDYGIVGTSAALSAIREGLPFRIVHGVIRTMEDLFWVSMPNSGIKSIKDLEGKRIGFTRPKSISETMILWMLEKNGMTGKAKLVSLGSVGAGLSALESGGVDATLILEPLWSQRKDRYQIAFTLSELPPMSQMVGIASTKILKEEPQVLRDLVAGWTQSVEMTYKQPDEAAALMSKRFGEKTLPPDVARSAVKNMAAINYWSRGEIDLEGLKFWLKTMKQQGEWEGADADWSQVVDQSALPAALRR